MDGEKKSEQFIWEMPENVDRDKTLNWLLVRSDLKVETEASLCTSQEQSITEPVLKHRFDRSNEFPLCRMCGKRGESAQYKISECD